MKLSQMLLFIPFLFIMACSAAYDEVKEIDASDPKTFHDYLLHNYQKNASFEANMMHDWNSAKLYSEKALKAFNGENLYPEDTNNWKIPTAKMIDIKSGYNNLLSIYYEALSKDPKNLAKAISSLDCWAEQEEEQWQTWDIDKCRNDFHNAMHNIYNTLLKETDKREFLEKQKKVEKENNVLVVTQNEKKEVMQIIYFDFDDFSLSEVSKSTLINFLEHNKKDLSEYIILGHTDTKGSNDYNLKLSFKRAETVKKILLENGISPKNVTILGKGEGNLAVSTPNDTKHPANRRAEVKILN